jgi:hypothetical protein
MSERAPVKPILLLLATNTEHVFDDLAQLRDDAAPFAPAGKRDACDTASRRLALRRRRASGFVGMKMMMMMMKRRSTVAVARS